MLSKAAKILVHKTNTGGWDARREVIFECLALIIHTYRLSVPPKVSLEGINSSVPWPAEAISILHFLRVAVCSQTRG